MAHVETIVFVSLILDLFAFTIPLPLFPRLIEWYTSREISDPHGFLSRSLGFVSSTRSLFYKPDVHSQRWDVVLLGGLMGSAFSTLQFIVAPQIGALSDKYGRKRILLMTMMGNILSALIWVKSTSFATYMLSRVVAGLSEGNVQLATAILSDVTSPKDRSKALAHIGIAFAICFCAGPPIGAYFASRPLPTVMNTWGSDLNIYAVPAVITLALLMVETVFLAYALPETRGLRRCVNVSSKAESAAENSISHANPDVSATGLSSNGPAPVGRAITTKTSGSTDDRADMFETPECGTKRSVEKRIKLLQSLRTLLSLFLALFSGVEFTLTFLTFDLLDWNNTQNGKLIGSIGIVSALLQGGYVRRSTSRVGEGVMARRGVVSCVLALVLLAILPSQVLTNPIFALRLLQGAAVCMAFTSATVVNALTAFASLQCDEGGFDRVTGKILEEHPQLAKGKALGQFRSSGQLGRAIGPILACAFYWTFGPSATYTVSAVAMTALALGMKRIAATRST